MQVDTIITSTNKSKNGHVFIELTDKDIEQIKKGESKIISCKDINLLITGVAMKSGNYRITEVIEDD